MRNIFTIHCYISEKKLHILKFEKRGTKVVEQEKI